MYSSSSPSSARSSTATRSSAGRSSTSTRPPCRKFKLDELEKATNWFDVSKIIATGEFGVTYEGFLDNGDTVAVKRYSIGGNNVDEYRNEIEKLTKAHNPHLVILIGKCDDHETNELIVVHEFMKNGTLEEHLFGGGERAPLSWDQRLRICIDAADGLEYLHHGFANTKKIVHRNINPATILLDENWTAKISEFGLARLGNANTKNTNIETLVKGPLKYLDPYYNLTAKLSSRTDIYAFGVVLLDVLFGKKDFYAGTGKQTLREWTQQCLKDGSLHSIIDERLKGQISPKTLNEFGELAFSCLHGEPLKRPTMTQVLGKLKDILKTSQQTGPC